MQVHTELIAIFYTVSQKNWTRVLWSITFTNIGQYQCHLTKLFIQQYLIIYHKNYSHRRVPAATVTMATSTTRADQRLRYYSASAHRARATVEYLRHATPDFISPNVWPSTNRDLSGRLQNLGLSSRPMFIRSAYATSTSWNITWLMYGQTQSLMGATTAWYLDEVPVVGVFPIRRNPICRN